MEKFLLSILLIISTISCESMPKTWDWGMKARPIQGVKSFPDYGKGYSDDYVDGFIAGCILMFRNTGRGAVAMTDIEHTARGRKIHALDAYKFETNSDWRYGWWDGYEQCNYIFDWDNL